MDETFGHSFKKTGFFERSNNKGPKILVCKCGYHSNRARKKVDDEKKFISNITISTRTTI